MKALRHQPLAKAIQLSLLISVPGLAAAQDAPAPAAEQKATTLDTITVTGSRIKRTDIETASPVFQIDRQAIDATGAQTIGAFIQSVPSMAGAATNPSVNNGGSGPGGPNPSGTGAATISLRGLTEVRTLILVNGRRIVTSDVNSIPMAMVERVEILKDGASAIYGSDAVGGVVNFIMRRNFEGSQVTVDYGISGQDDGERYGISGTLGLSGDRGSFILGVNYHNQKEVLAADRDFSKNALTLYAGSVVVGGSSRTTTGRYAVPESIAGLDCNGDGDFADTAGLTHIAGTPGTSVGDFRCFTGADLFNYQAVGNVELTPQERTGVFLTGNYDVTENVSAYLDAFFNRTSSASQIAPLPFDGRPGNDSVVISADNIYNPFGVDIVDSRLRVSDLGNRRFSFNTEVNQFNGGLKGNFGDSTWSWDAGVSYGRITQRLSTSGYMQSSKLADGLGPSFIDANGVARCGTPTEIIANCVPLNFFGVPYDLNTPEGQAAKDALAAITVESNTHKVQVLRGFQANFAGDLFELPAGTVKAAVGVEYRKASLNFTPDSLSTLNPDADFTCEISSEACASRTSGFTETKEVYGEVLIPVLADAPFAKSLNLTLGTRYSRYNSFGNTTNSKLGVEWRPMDSLLLRSTYAQVFRAPTVTDLYGGLFAFSAGYTDPCVGYTGPLNGNPACQGVPNDGSYRAPDTQLSAFVGGNPDLKPEEGSVFTMGMVYEPEWLPGFSTTIDAWKVHLDDTIGTFGTFTILQECFRSTVANPSPFCSLFSRDPNSGDPVRLFDRVDNVGDTDTKGVDIGFRYKTETPWGRIRASLDTTYVAQYDTKIIVDGVVTAEQHNAGTYLGSANGGLGNYSRWRGIGVLGWDMGNWDAQWTTRYIHGFRIGNEDVPTVPCADRTGGPICELDFGAQTYHNLEVGYKLPWNMRVRVGVDNLFDKQPPIMYQNNTADGNTDPQTFDTVGRYYWANFTVNFK
ncbi:TonB-dependent receptor domain-containing protein [Lysobacter solisilvae (ex Woo and Kim 2020)]|uniref:TonB-dependent receptor n=1 Tax=Agrilutibacter terrestris TaxID=2865112 RepID=A0A7H0G0H7_9GAMM|nr:TonB-dependent receptor [Lysobacter terrestris]QNP41793.1 TonB-dependent receptor [Lysobacter terrestris]